MTNRGNRSELNCAFCSLRKEENSINNTTHNTWRRSSIFFSHHLFWLTNRCVRCITAVRSFPAWLLSPLKESEKKVTNTIFFNVSVDACVILNWKLGRGSLSSVKDFFIFSHSSLCFLVNVLIFDLQSTDDLMSPFNGLLENSRVSYHFLRFIYFFCSLLFKTLDSIHDNHKSFCHHHKRHSYLSEEDSKRLLRRKFVFLVQFCH